MAVRKSGWERAERGREKGRTYHVVVVQHYWQGYWQGQGRAAGSGTSYRSRLCSASQESRIKRQCFFRGQEAALVAIARESEMEARNLEGNRRTQGTHAILPFSKHSGDQGSRVCELR